MKATEQETYVDIALDKIKQVDEMVDKLFELSRIESVEFKATKEPFVFSEIVQETVKTFKLAAAQKNIQLKCTQCQDHIWVNADVGMMERVVQNLVDNAVANTPENGQIQVSLILENDELFFKIQNSGNPLPSDLLEWINNFEEDNPLTANWSSRSGIGLLIVKKILQLHGSFLKAYADSGTGNVFTFSLPVYNQ